MVTVFGTALDYEWRRDGVPLVDGPTVNGAHSAHLALSGVTAVDEGDRLVGFGYGYTTMAGQWWHDQVRLALGPDLASKIDAVTGTLELY